MRTAYEANPSMSEAEAQTLLERCLRVLYYRDGRSLNRVCAVIDGDSNADKLQYQIATVTAEGVKISEPRSAETNWAICHLVRYATRDLPCACSCYHSQRLRVVDSKNAPLQSMQ